MRSTLCVLGVLVLGAGLARAAPGEDPIASKLYPPELVMSHQQELGVDDKQRDAIVKEIQKTQAQITEAQWQLQAAAEELSRLLDGAKVDEAKALAQAEKVMNLERDVKK